MEEEYKYDNGDLVDFHREPNAVHAKDQSGWRGPATIVDLTTLDEGTIGVKWNGTCILTSVRTTGPHISYPVLVKIKTLTTLKIQTCSRWIRISYPCRLHY